MNQLSLTEFRMDKKCASCGKNYGSHQRKTDACPVYKDINLPSFVGYDKSSTFKEHDGSVNPVGIPFLYRYRHGEKTIFVVTVSRCISYTSYDVSWMNDDTFLMEEDYSVYVPDVDIKKDSFIFDSGNPAADHRNALDKMKEMWRKVQY